MIETNTSCFSHTISAHVHTSCSVHCASTASTAGSQRHLLKNARQRWCKLMRAIKGRPGASTQSHSLQVCKTALLPTLQAIKGRPGTRAIPCKYYKTASVQTLRAVDGRPGTSTRAIPCKYCKTALVRTLRAKKGSPGNSTRAIPGSSHCTYCCHPRILAEHSSHLAGKGCKHHNHQNNHSMIVMIESCCPTWLCPGPSMHGAYWPGWCAT